MWFWRIAPSRKAKQRRNERGARNEPPRFSGCTHVYNSHSLGAYVETAEKNVYTNNEHKQRCFVCANCAEDSQELRDADLCFYCMERLCRKMLGFERRSLHSVRGVGGGVWMGPKNARLAEYEARRPAKDQESVSEV